MPEPATLGLSFATLHCTEKKKKRNRSGKTTLGSLKRVCCVVPTRPWLTDALCWLRKDLTDTITEKHGLHLVRDTLVHHRAVLEALDLEVKPLVRLAPANLHWCNVKLRPSHKSVHL